MTSVNPDGVNLQVLGFFDGTIDLFHLPKNPEKPFKVGKKIKARILYNYSTSPPKFGLALSDHVMHLRPRLVSSGEDATQLQEAYPIGTILHAVKVLRVEKERGLIVDVGENQEGFVHVRPTKVFGVDVLIRTCRSPISLMTTYHLLVPQDLGKLGRFIVLVSLVTSPSMVFCNCLSNRPS